ncbi:MAG: LptF/LptG family permease, partial [Planctomycetes bacterium]|nr:LptF/LptG family permease [Planctomycetota bacterium]
DRYFLGIFVQSLVVVTALFTTVFLVVDVLLNLDKIQNFPDVAEGTTLFYAFNLPPILYLLYPFMVIAAGMFAVARVIRSRELLLLEAAGVGQRRALAAIMIPALLLGVLGLGLRELALPSLADAARESPYGAFEYRKGKRVSVRDDDGNVWFVRRYNLDTRTIEDVRVLSLDGSRVIVAKELRWVDERNEWWSPTEATVYDLAGLTGQDPVTDGKPGHFDGSLPFGKLYPADFARRRRSYSDRPLTQLWSDSTVSPDDLDLRTNLWHELWHPFAGFILLSCGVGLILSRRGLKAFTAGSLAILCVVGYQILQFWFETLAQSGAFSPAIGASITPVLFSIFAGV